MTAREAAIDSLAAQRGVSREEAERIYKQMLTAVLTDRAVDRAADNVGRAAMWTFVAMLLAGAAAAFGGSLGRTRDVIVAR